jgi:hypothetical protein
VLAVENAPGDVLGSRVFPALQDDGLNAFLSQKACGRNPGRPGANNGHIKRFLHLLSLAKKLTAEHAETAERISTLLKKSFSPLGCHSRGIRNPGFPVKTGTQSLK